MNDHRPKVLPKFKLDQEVHVWTFKVPDTENIPSAFYALLSAKEKAKAQKFVFEKDKLVSVCARGILRHLLGLYLQQFPTDVSLEYGTYGKPYVPNTSLKFNVSHAHKMIVFAFVHHHDIGVDVEYIKRDFNVLDIVDNYFSAQEIKAIHRYPKALQTDIFYRGWTRKEAFIKAKATGLSFPLDQFSVSLDSETSAKVYETQWDATEAKDWQLIPFETSNAYKAALAFKGNVDKVSYFDFNFNDHF